MLTITLVCVGRLKAGAERDLTARYLDRAGAAGRAIGLAVELRELPESRARRPADRKAEEAVALRAIATDSFIAFDERGGSFGSEAFAGDLRHALDSGTGRLALIIGGPDGLDTSIVDAAARTIALGAMTWPHQLVRVMVAEQIYRAVTILTGHPYHRA